MDCDTVDAGFLNARQEAFCRAFVAGGSAVAAARSAGYAETTARAQATRLLQHPGIQQRIEQLRADEDSAKAALCGRLLQDVHAIRERAMDNGDDSMALRAINTTLRVVRQLGMPATPPDTQDVLLDGAMAETTETAAEDLGPAPDVASADDIDLPPSAEKDEMGAAIAGTVTAATDPNSDAALQRELAGPSGDRLARMLASVGECRSNGAADGPTSAKPPP